MGEEDTPSLLIAAPADESCVDHAIQGKRSARQGAAAAATPTIGSTLALARPLTTIVSRAV
jgi:TctA family transporter